MLSVEGEVNWTNSRVRINQPLPLPELIHDGGFESADSSPPFICFIAEEVLGNGPHPIGFAVCHNSYSTWKGKSLFLADLYVRPIHQGKGVGRKIFTEVAQYAHSTNCSRVEFHVSKANPARKFYEKLKMVDLASTEGWLCYRLDKAAIQSLAVKWSTHLQSKYISLPKSQRLTLFRYSRIDSQTRLTAWRILSIESTKKSCS